MFKCFAPDAHAWTGHSDGTIDTTSNGLNQLTGAGGTTLELR